jgi:hypothetical protein
MNNAARSCTNAVVALIAVPTGTGLAAAVSILGSYDNGF